MAKEYSLNLQDFDSNEKLRLQHIKIKQIISDTLQEVKQKLQDIKDIEETGHPYDENFLIREKECYVDSLISYLNRLSKEEEYSEFFVLHPEISEYLNPQEDISPFSKYFYISMSSARKIADSLLNLNSLQISSSDQTLKKIYELKSYQDHISKLQISNIIENYEYFDKLFEIFKHYCEVFQSTENFYENILSYNYDSQQLHSDQVNTLEKKLEEGQRILDKMFETLNKDFDEQDKLISLTQIMLLTNSPPSPKEERQKDLSAWLNKINKNKNPQNKLRLLDRAIENIYQENISKEHKEKIIASLNAKPEDSKTQDNFSLLIQEIDNTYERFTLSKEDLIQKLSINFPFSEDITIEKIHEYKTRDADQKVNDLEDDVLCIYNFLSESLTNLNNIKKEIYEELKKDFLEKVLVNTTDDLEDFEPQDADTLYLRKLLEEGFKTYEEVLKPIYILTYTLDSRRYLDQSHDTYPIIARLFQKQNMLKSRYCLNKEDFTKFLTEIKEFLELDRSVEALSKDPNLFETLITGFRFKESQEKSLDINPEQNQNLKTIRERSSSFTEKVKPKNKTIARSNSFCCS